MRVHFLIDGFNLYHSVREAESRTGGQPLRWLDQRGLCETIMRSTLGPGASLNGVECFSALARHLRAHKPDVVKRHQTYIAALEATGVRVSLATFKKKERVHPLAHFKVRLSFVRRWRRLNLNWILLWSRTHEEKETDVAVACRLLELLQLGQCDTVYVVSGDTDLAPAIKTARALFPAASVCVAFPYDRHNKALEKLATRTIKLTAHLYQAHQLPDPVVAPNGERITKPTKW
jgi:hypothetical protein